VTAVMIGAKSTRIIDPQKTCNYTVSQKPPPFYFSNNSVKN